MKFVLTCIDDDLYDVDNGRKVTVEFTADYVEDVLSEVGYFLKACTFEVDGDVVIQSQQEPTEEDNDWAWDYDEETEQPSSFEVTFSDGILASAINHIDLTMVLRIKLIADSLQVLIL